MINKSNFILKKEEFSIPPCNCQSATPDVLSEVEKMRKCAFILLEYPEPKVAYASLYFLVIDEKKDADFYDLSKGFINGIGGSDVINKSILSPYQIGKLVCSFKEKIKKSYLAKEKRFLFFTKKVDNESIIFLEANISPNGNSTYTSAAKMYFPDSSVSWISMFYKFKDLNIILTL